MSGGSYNYTCFRVEDEYVGQMHDKELDEMMRDLVNVLHDVEWWQSSDIGEDDYRKIVRAFKEKWFNQTRAERLIPIIDKEIDRLRTELVEMVGGKNECID